LLAHDHLSWVDTDGPGRATSTTGGGADDRCPKYHEIRAASAWRYARERQLSPAPDNPPHGLWPAVCQRTNPLTRERAAREDRSKRQRMHV